MLGYVAFAYMVLMPVVLVIVAVRQVKNPSSRWTLIVLIGGGVIAIAIYWRLILLLSGSM